MEGSNGLVPFGLFPKSGKILFQVCFQVGDVRYRVTAEPAVRTLSGDHSSVPMFTRPLSNTVHR